MKEEAQLKEMNNEFKNAPTFSFLIEPTIKEGLYGDQNSHNSMGSHLTTREDWDSYWKKYKPKVVEHIIYEDILRKFLYYDSNLSCIEIGCVPGEFLIFFNKVFGYKITGIDFNARSDFLWGNLKVNDVASCQYYNADFTTWKTNDRFDIVCSFGFIEHFKNSELIIAKHIDLLAEGGMLILGCPNFRYAQFLFHKLFDRDNIEKHNLEIMDLKYIREIIEKFGLSVLFLGYYGTVDFWAEGLEQEIWIKKQIIKLFMFTARVINKFINFPNHYFSPYILCIAQK